MGYQKKVNKDCFDYTIEDYEYDEMNDSDYTIKGKMDSHGKDFSDAKDCGCYGKDEYEDEKCYEKPKMGKCKEEEYDYEDEKCYKKPKEDKFKGETCCYGPYYEPYYVVKKCYKKYYIMKRCYCYKVPCPPKCR